MVRFFSDRITTRLAVLTDNCRRFVARQNLNSPIFGGDEIANLDSHIHEMARKVRSAEQKRDEYVQMVNHDLRSPLAAIQTVLAGTLKGLYGELTEKGKTRISDAGADASRLVDLINEVMETDSLESGQFQLNRESFNMSDLIASVIASLRPLMEQKQIKVEFAPVETPVQADRARLYRVITNFLDNAIKYSPSDSTIEIGINSSPGKVEVEVKDEGPGIKSGDNERIFAAYDRGTDAKSLEKPGKGLGLAICKAIIEAHGGHIGGKSRDERGSVFWFAIPSGPMQDGESA
jgi:signal transduction histidine kinase